MQNIYDKAIKLSIAKLSLYSFLILLGSNLTVAFLSTVFNISNSKPLTKLADEDVLNIQTIFSHLFKTVLIAPLIETLIFQLLLINLFILAFKHAQYKQNAMCWIIILSSLIFGLAHWSSTQYMFRAFLTGIILNTTFFIAMSRNNKIAFFVTAGIHALWNLFSALLFITIKDI